MRSREQANWIMRGYTDARDGEPYKRAPEGDCPELPTAMLPDAWRLYFEGWNAGIMDGVARTLRTAE